MELSRRRLLRAAGLAGLVAALPGCAADFRGQPLRIAAGVPASNYRSLGDKLRRLGVEELGLSIAESDVQQTGGSLENVQRLVTGAADLGFSQVDAVPHDAPLQALARIYDELVQVVVPADSPVTALADLRGARVSVGAPGSGVRLIADRLLGTLGLTAERDLRSQQLGLRESADALLGGQIDAFFWCSAVTEVLAQLSQRRPIRLLPLDDRLAPMQEDHPEEYTAGTVPAGSYAGVDEPVSTLAVRNLLLVGATIPDGLARALLEVMFDRRDGLSPMTLDERSALFTQPVVLHPEALAYYRDADGST